MDIGRCSYHTGYLYGEKVASDSPPSKQFRKVVGLKLRDKKPRAD